MPLQALPFYITSKHKHEVLRDAYITDMLRLLASRPFASIEDGKEVVCTPAEIPRYFEMVQDKPTPMQTHEDVDVFSVFAQIASGDH